MFHGSKLQTSDSFECLQHDSKCAIFLRGKKPFFMHNIFRTLSDCQRHLQSYNLISKIYFIITRHLQLLLAISPEWCTVGLLIINYWLKLCNTDQEEIDKFLTLKYCTSAKQNPAKNILQKMINIFYHH